MAKSAAAIYAQLRRDNENEMREKVRALVSDQYFTETLMANGDYNLSTKVFIATEAYLRDISVDEQKIERVKQPEDEPCKVVQQSQLFVIPKHSSNKILENEALRQLRQVATRLVQKAEERCQAEGEMPKELRKMIESASELMIDTIENMQEQV